MQIGNGCSDCYLALGGWGVVTNFDKICDKIL
jgi:hypothetical protein